MNSCLTSKPMPAEVKIILLHTMKFINYLYLRVRFVKLSPSCFVSCSINFPFQQSNLEFCVLWLAFKTVISLQRISTQNVTSWAFCANAYYYYYYYCKCLFKDFLCSGWTGAAMQQSKLITAGRQPLSPRYCSERGYICLSLWGLCIKAFLSSGHMHVVLFQLIIKS